MEEELELAKESMQQSLNALVNNLSTLRTGRASARMLDSVMVDYYGDKISLISIASVSVPEARQLLVKPYDKNDIKAIIGGINEANLGVTPLNDGNVIRINIPPLT